MVAGPESFAQEMVVSFGLRDMLTDIGEVHLHIEVVLNPFHDALKFVVSTLGFDIEPVVVLETQHLVQTIIQFGCLAVLERHARTMMHRVIHS